MTSSLEKIRSKNKHKKEKDMKKFWTWLKISLAASAVIAAVSAIVYVVYKHFHNEDDQLNYYDDDDFDIWEDDDWEDDDWEYDEEDDEDANSDDLDEDYYHNKK